MCGSSLGVLRVYREDRLWVLGSIVECISGARLIEFH
jgi:hypothetical protein